MDDGSMDQQITVLYIPYITLHLHYRTALVCLIVRAFCSVERELCFCETRDVSSRQPFQPLSLLRSDRLVGPSPLIRRPSGGSWPQRKQPKSVYFAWPSCR